MERDSGYALCLPCPPSPPLEPSGFSQRKAFSPRQWSMTVCHHTAAGMIATNLWEKDEVRLRGGKTTERSGEAGLVPRLLSQRKGEQGLWHIISGSEGHPRASALHLARGVKPGDSVAQISAATPLGLYLPGTRGPGGPVPPPHPLHPALCRPSPRLGLHLYPTPTLLDCASTPLTVGRGTHTHTHTHTRSHSGSWRHLGTSFRESLCTVWARLDSRLQNVEPSKGNEP